MLRNLLRVCGAAAALALIVPSSPSGAAATAPVLGPHGFDLTDIDHTCKACDDFYEFSTGQWQKTHPIPPDKTSYGSFNVLADRNMEQLHAIADAAAADTSAAADSPAGKVGAFYSACMDTADIERAGLTPLEAPLAVVDAVSAKSDVAAATARLQRMGFGVFFRASASQDAKHASDEIFELRQGGLGLPDRDYYLKDDAATSAIRDAYTEHIGKLFALTGSDAATAAGAASHVMTIETALARASSPRPALRDPDANYHVVPVSVLQTTYANFDFASYMNARQVPHVDSVVVGQPAFLAGLNDVLAGASLDDIKTYMRWAVISRNGTALPEAIDREDFAFAARLSGAKEQEPRWKRCVRATDASIGEALGQLYVAKTFTPQAKAKALALVDNLQGVLRYDIGSLPWMSAATRAQAQAKLDAYRKKIAYPDRWKTYPFAVSRTTPYANVLAADELEDARDIAKIGKPIDRTEWGMTPPTVNAYYNPFNNEIVFPAGILQPPFYDPNADDAYNYGGIGVVIGHEMTHGFDDQGSRFDAHGNLKSFWTPADRAAFDKRADCVANYEDTLTVVPGVHQTGKLVEGEAIADLGGATIAYKAYMRSLAGKPGAVIDGYTPEQRFFLGFAQVWAANIRDQQARLYAATDPHPADRNRVNATSANMPEFAAAWQCPLTAAMVRPPADRCQIW